MSEILTEEEFKHTLRAALRQVESRTASYECGYIESWPEEEVAQLVAHDAALRAKLAEHERLARLTHAWTAAGHALDEDAWRSALDQIEQLRAKLEASEKRVELLRTTLRLALGLNDEALAMIIAKMKGEPPRG